MLSTTVSSRIFRFVRDKKQLSLSEMALCLGLDQATLERIENGDVFPSFEALQSLQQVCSRNEPMGISSLQTTIKMLGVGE